MPDLQRFRVWVDGEILDVPAVSLLHAFTVARAVRPGSVVVSDTYGRPKTTSVTVVSMTATEIEESS